MSRKKREWPEKDEQTEQGYVTITIVARRAHQTRHIVSGAIMRGELSAVKGPSKYSRSGFEWNIRLEDAEVYIARYLPLSDEGGSFRIVGAALPEIAGENPDEGAVLEEKLPKAAEDPDATVKPLGNPNLCGSCGRDTGNILGDVDDHTREQYGYLCYRCHKLVQMFRGDTLRMAKVLDYLKKTREDPSRR